MTLVHLEIVSKTAINCNTRAVKTITTSFTNGTCNVHTFNISTRCAIDQNRKHALARIDPCQRTDLIRTCLLFLSRDFSSPEPAERRHKAPVNGGRRVFSVTRPSRLDVRRVAVKIRTRVTYEGDRRNDVSRFMRSASKVDREGYALLCGRRKSRIKHVYDMTDT